MNCESTEGLIPITVENPSWSTTSRDWSEEVERASADDENDFNSSPQHHTVPDLTRHNDIKQKQTLRNSQTQSIVYSDLTQCAGIGRGKYKVKSSNSLNTDRRISDTGLLCNNTQIDSEIMSSNSVEETVDSNSSCNSPYPEEPCNSDALNKDNKESPVFSNPGEDDVLSIQTHINGAFSLQGDIRNRNIPIPNIDHSRDYDYKKMANGMESLRGYRSKPSRMNRVPANNANPIQYAKSFDNRTFGHRYPPPPPQPMPSLNVKNYRPVKPHENHYRHYDNRRHQQSSRQPFPMSIDKVAYAKHKSNIYPERDFLDVNRNFAPQNFSIPNELNRHISPVSYVPQANVPTFRAKHNPRLNCEKLVCNKNEPLTAPKNWSLAGVIPDSNTSTVSCHSRSVVTPMKTVVSPHCATCTTHPHEKHCPSLKEDSQQKKNFPNPCDTFNPSHTQNYGTIEMDLRSKLNNSPVCDVRNMRMPREDNSTNSSCERLPITDHAHSNHDYMQTNSVEAKPHFVKNNSSDSSDPYLRDVNYPGVHLRKDFPEKAIVSSPSVSSGNVPLPKQLPMDYRNSDNSQVLTLHEDPYRSSPVSTVPHSSYADIIRMPADTVSKVSSCQMANCMEMTVSKSTEYSSNINEKLNPKLEADHASSEWVLSRLSQIDMNADLVNVNASHQVVNTPRPIAVNLEKPSFYNSKTGISGTVNANIQPSNLSSPERKMLECQYVEEQLGAMLGYKKAGDKLSFLTDLPPNLASGEAPNACVPSNIRTDSTFSDTSSVCSSMSGTFKGEGHFPMVKSNTPPVIIMNNNNYGTSEAVSEISFGIEMDEIIKLCGDSDLDSVGDSSVTVLSDSGFSSNKVDVATCEIEDEEDAACHMKQNENYLVVCNKKLLWKDTVDVSKCNMPQIVGFLQESIGEGVTPAVKFYREE